ncbi:MAG: hypothetical protein JSU69_02970 [Candidatus Zixiibacteriota bacterium]|nr:MAG: hypothetical protein JSU69_02970 [candidate division Zixibacteria bacterium]
MPGEPDIKWQSLIDDYLDKLHAWQRLASRQTSVPTAHRRPHQPDKMSRAYQAMKEAERALKQYEAEKGY